MSYAKSFYTAIGLAMWFLVILCSSSCANVPPDPNTPPAPAPAGDVELPFNPNDYAFLAYDPGGDQASIRQALDRILGRELDESEIRTSETGRHVTLNDLSTHDILIVGWNLSGDARGLDANVLAQGITGRVLLTGHDLDWHTVHGPSEAETMFVQAIDWVLQGDGTGLIVLGSHQPMPYLPSEWLVSANAGDTGEDIDDPFTAEALLSGVYDGLTHEDMSGWGTSYHTTFETDPNSPFLPFEYNESQDVVTLANAKACRIGLLKHDDVAIGDTNDPEYHTCVSPDDTITCTIAVHPADVEQFQVTVTDTLPLDLAYVSSDPAAMG